ncbi:MAG: hypothetical protein WC501_04085 [Candidatus Micrarchaeia archaeon]
MAIITCERCGNQTAKVEKCNYCNLTICNDCIKSQKRNKKILRAFICKSCWSNMKKRKSYKSL